MIMNAKPKKKKTIWQSLLRIIIILASTLATSQVATTNDTLDLAVKTAIVSTSNVLIDALSSNAGDTAIIITEKSAAVEMSTTNSNN